MKYITGENYLCFYSLMEMVLDDAGYPDWTQYKLANIFGVVLPKGYAIPGITNVEYNDNECMLGAHIDCKKINDFMIENHINLTVSYISSNPYGEYDIDKQYLINKYCICTYSYGALYNQKKSFNAGHASLFIKYDSDEEVVIYDPGPKQVGKKRVRICNLYDAIYDARGGFYIFEKGNSIAERYFISKKEECKGKCKYCFGKWNDYLKFPDMVNIDSIKDNTILYPNCDGNIFDGHWNKLKDIIRNIPSKNVVVSISTKMDINDEVLDDLKQIDEMLRKNGGMLKISLSFSCESSINEIESNTANYMNRIALIERIVRKKIPYVTIIKPILPFIKYEEYQKIIDDTIKYSKYYVIGDLYVDIKSEFYKKYIATKGYLLQKRDVEWNGENGVWNVVLDYALREKIIKYIGQLGGEVFESDKDVILTMLKLT